jgi:anti-sigma factor RsiW
MNCSVWEERIALYQGGELPAGQMGEVEGHLGECAGCQVFASGLKESLEVLRAAHGDLPAPAHFAAVRVRVLAEVERSHRPLWRRVLAWSTVAAGILVMAAVMRLYRPVPAPPVVALARPAAPELRAPVSKRRPAPRVRVVETVTIKLMTDDPDVVIYWIADRKGE